MKIPAWYDSVKRAHVVLFEISYRESIERARAREMEKQPKNSISSKQYIRESYATEVIQSNIYTHTLTHSVASAAFVDTPKTGSTIPCENFISSLQFGVRFLINIYTFFRFRLSAAHFTRSYFHSLVFNFFAFIRTHSFSCLFVVIVLFGCAALTFTRIAQSQREISSSVISHLRLRATCKLSYLKYINSTSSWFLTRKAPATESKTKRRFYH